MTQSTCNRSSSSSFGIVFSLALMVLVSLGSTVGAADTQGRPAKDPVVGSSGTGKPTPDSAASVFLGPMEKASLVLITDLENGKSSVTSTDSNGQYRIVKGLPSTVIYVMARGRVFDLSSGRMTDTTVILSAAQVRGVADADPQVNILSTLVAARANALAGPVSRGPFARIAMPASIQQAEQEVQDALAVALIQMRQDESTLATEKDPRADGTAGQVQLIHVSMVVSEAASRRVARGTDPAVGIESIIEDMVQQIANFGRFESSLVQELRTAEQNMNAVQMLRTLQQEFGFGANLLPLYR
jgi:hypothetical protein